MWNAGWSHGKEKLGETPDLAKGSFYANPLYDSVDAPEETKKKYPFAYPDNIWPTEDIPELEPALKSMGKVMYDVVVLLSKQIDALAVKKVPSYEPETLYKLMSSTKKIKARLLYYYPCDSIAEDGWIGWHNDSGFLTGITPALYFNDDTGDLIDNPDPNGGLWITDRGHSPVRARIPADHMAVQCGECLQIITGGLLVATPHCVRSSISADKRVGRAAFPVFVDTDIEYALNAPRGVSEEQVFDKTVESKVPPLRGRWKGNGQLFADFLGDTFKQYYEWAM